MGWADDEEEFPEAVVARGRALGAYGREHDLPVLDEPETLTHGARCWTASGSWPPACWT